MHNVNKSLMFPLFLYLQATTSPLVHTPTFTPFMFFSVAWLRLITFSLFALPLVRSHEDVICKFSSSV